jgi:uncharacterized membrane protein YbhN (UPF0104 family)
MTVVGHQMTLRWFARLCVSFVLLVVLARWLEVDEIAARLTRMRSSWVGVALALSVVQVAASAWRWRFTAGRLGIELPFSIAVREYYLAMFLNQVIPGGVVGDVSRAWRHARAQSTLRSVSGSTVHAVIIERASGQVVMVAVAMLSVLSLPVGLGVTWWWAVLAAGTVVSGCWLWIRNVSEAALVGRFWRDARIALFTGLAFPLQFASSILVVATYLLTYLIAALAIGVDTPPVVLAPLVAPVLLTMLIPVAVAGWGVREGAAAVLWGIVGLTSVDGVAISITYGFLVLLSTLPGMVVLVLGVGVDRESATTV